MEHYTLTKPIAEIWTSARAMFTRLRGLVGAKQWLYALEALVRKLVLLEALALAPALPKLPPIQLPLYMQMKLPPPPRERAKTYAFRLWPRAKPHPARIRLLGKAQSRAELERDALYRAQLERLKLARQKRLPEAQRIVRRIGALSRVLEKPLTYARRFARKLAKTSKQFLAKIALKRPPRSPYVDQRLQRDAEQHVWAAARAAYAKRDSDTS
jgi:hypothetical protein